MKQTAHKAVAAALSSVVALVALFVPAVGDYASPELVAAVATIITPVVVYLVPNKVLQ